MARFNDKNVMLVGLKGKDGLSAYEVAVKNGFEGTEDEWLESLSPTNLQNGEGTDSLVQKYSGEVDDTHYENTNTGKSAVVFGEANNNKGMRALMTGHLNKNIGQNIVAGLKNNVAANNAIVGGQSNGGIGTTFDDKGIPTLPTRAQSSIISGSSNEVGSEDETIHHSIVGGGNNKVSASYSITGGYGNKNNSKHSIIAGIYNDNKENTLIEIGNGTSDENRSNAFEVYKNGRAKVYGAPTEDEDVVRKLELDEKIVVVDVNTMVSKQEISKFLEFRACSLFWCICVYRNVELSAVHASNVCV